MPLAHSYSSLDTYDKCPLKYYYLKIGKEVKDLGNKFTKYGELVHKSLADRLLSNKPLPSNFGEYESLCAALENKELKVEAEIQMCLNKDLEPTAWFARDAWMRSIVDVLLVDHKNHTATVMDWKTGKPNTNYAQLELFALQVFAHYPKITKVNAAFIWLKNMSIDSKSYDKDAADKMWEAVHKKIDRVEQSVEYETWTPKPSWLCKYCPAKDICDFAQI